MSCLFLWNCIRLCFCHCVLALCFVLSLMCRTTQRAPMAKLQLFMSVCFHYEVARQNGSLSFFFFFFFLRNSVVMCILIPCFFYFLKGNIVRDFCNTGVRLKILNVIHRMCFITKFCIHSIKSVVRFPTLRFVYQSHFHSFCAMFMQCAADWLINDMFPDHTTHLMKNFISGKNGQ